MVEFALLLPLLLLVVVGGLFLSLSILVTTAMTHAATESARSAAVAGAEDSACEAAIEAAEAVLDRPYTGCDGSDGLAMSYDPADDPPTVSITITGEPIPVPLFGDVTPTGSATAIIREEEAP